MSIKKIGIITTQKQICSYGAALQAYATWKYINTHGYDVELIDLCLITRFRFRPSEQYKQPNQKLRKNIVHGLIFDYLKNPLRIYRFGRFNRQSKYSKTYMQFDDIYRIPPEYDVYITGSDQTWNPLGQNIEPNLLTFIGSDKKKISYASSIGINDLPLEYHDLFKKALPEYRYVSVREVRAKEIIEELTGRQDVVVVLDPTMLLTKEHYLSIAKMPKRSDYMLAFFLGNTLEKLKYSESVADNNNKPLVVIGEKIKGIKATFISNAGPREWLGLIANASHVITDSFHGTVFSLLFNKKFKTLVLNMDRASRIFTLLKLFDLDSNIIYNLDSFYNISDINYNVDELNGKIKEIRQKSQEWLINAIDN
jgi:hypothetical protein